MRTRKNGFTMVEILIAMIIMIVGILPFVMAMQQNMRSRGVSREISVASELAQSRIESVAMNATTWSVVAGTQSGSESVTKDGRNYAVTWTATPASFLPGGKALWSLRVQASWTYFLSRSVTFSRVVVGR